MGTNTWVQYRHNASAALVYRKASDPGRVVVVERQIVA